MKLHTKEKAFAEAIQAASSHFNMPPVFVEKDYWISLVLKRLSESNMAESVVFKGGTSLSKAYKLTKRFSEDIDLALINAGQYTGNQLKTQIRKVVKSISADLTETDVPGITSKGSRFRKSVFKYLVTGNYKFNRGISDMLMIEVNSFANPYPYEKHETGCIIHEFLMATGRQSLSVEYGLEAFPLNVLDKRRTLTEKMVSLTRFSFADDPAKYLADKIRHFYDIFYLANDGACKAYINSGDFRKDFHAIIGQDRHTFDDPPGWTAKPLTASPLFNDFEPLWDKLKSTYAKELALLSFAPLPNERDVQDAFLQTLGHIDKTD